MSLGIYFLNMLVQIIVIVFYFNQFLKPRKSFLTSVAMYFLPFILITIISYLGGDKDFDSNFNHISRYTLLIVVVYLSYSDSALKKIVMGILFIFTELTCEKFTLIFFYKIFGNLSAQEIIDQHYMAPGQMMISDVVLLFVVIVTFIINYRKFRLENLLMYLAYMLCFVSLHLVFLIAYYLINRDNVSEANNMIQLGFQTLLYIMIFIQYYNLRSTSRLREAEREYKAMQNRMENDYNYYMLADSKFTEISELRHDIQNQFQTIRTLLNTSNGRNEAENIIEDIQQRLLSVKSVNYCENHTINAVLTVKLNEEKINKIQTQVILKDCSGLPYDDYDLCSLFSNLFDNAAESCMKSGDISKTFIEIRSGVQGGFFIIKFINSCLNEIEKGKSHKSEPGHGYGTKIAENICRKYKGSFELKKVDDTAVATATLNLKF